MHTSLFMTLALGAVTVGALHSLAPDHWVPISAVARARGWSAKRTAFVTLLCSLGHVTVSVVLGLLALVFGAAIFEQLGARMESAAGLLLVGFGVAYAAWGMRHKIVRRLHGHHHDRYDHVHDPSRATTWSLVAIYSVDPCIALIPILFAAAPLHTAEILSVIVLYEIATIATMVALVSAARAGVQKLRGHWFDRYGDSTAGSLIAITGVAVMLLGW